MPATFTEILNSKLCNFLVGYEVDGRCTKFMVYEGGMAQLSSGLKAMMNKDYPGTEARTIIWGKVSKDTFERLAQFAYTGDYAVPKPPRRHGWMDSDDDDGLADTLGSTLYNATPTKDTNKKKRKLVHRPVASEPVLSPIAFRSLSFPLLAPRDNHQDACNPSKPFDPYEIYADIFLSHASLWVLADLQGIDSLKALTLFKLHKTLCVFEVDDLNVGDVISLVRYAYSECQGKRTGLKSLVAQYAASYLRTLSQKTVFMNLVSEGGEFVTDFVKFLA